MQLEITEHGSLEWRSREQRQYFCCFNKGGCQGLQGLYTHRQGLASIDERLPHVLTPSLTPLSLYQVGLAKKVEKPSRKLRKERKNRAKKVTGVAKKKAGDPAKKK